MNFGELYPDAVSSVQKAVLDNDLDLLERLLSISSSDSGGGGGRPVDVKDNRGWSPVHEAAYRGHTGCLKIILQALDSRDDPEDKIVVVNAKTHNQETALYLACSKGHYEIVKLLIGHGAFINEESYMDETALFAAVRSGVVSLVEYLIINGATVLKSAFEGLSPLHDACIKNNAKIVQLLLNVGCSINTKTSNGATPLFMSALYGSYDCIKILTTDRPDCEVNCRTSLGMTPLYVAVMGDYINCVRLLLFRGADPNIAEYQNKELPVHVAASRGNIECLTLLYPVSEIGHRIKLTGKPMPLLWLAVESCSTKCVGYLMEQGCDIFEAICECDEPCTPFRLAVKENFQTVAGFITNGTIDPSDGMAEVFKVYHIRGKSIYLQQVLEILLQHGASFKQNSVYDIQETLCVSLRYPTVQFLLKCGLELISNKDKACGGGDMCVFLCKLFDRERSSGNRQGDVDRIVSRLLGALKFCHFSLCQCLNERIQGHDKYQEIVELTETPQLLQKTCRTVVRNMIFKNLNVSKNVWELYEGSAIDKLPVPDVVKSFLKFDDG